MAFFKKLFKPFKKFLDITTLKPGRFILKKTTKPIRKAIGALFKGIIPKVPGLPDIPTPAGAPTFAQAGGPASRSGAPSVNIGLSLISSGGAAGLTKRARTKKRTLIGGA